MDRVGRAGERLTGLDTAFLGLESGRAPMHLGALAVFHPPRPVAPARLRALLCERAERVPRLRRRVTPAWFPPGAVSWGEDPTFDPGRHIQVSPLDHPDRETVATAAAALMAEPLNLRRPPWQVRVLTGLPGGRFALLVKLHHALADGLRAVELGLGLLDGFSDRSWPEPTGATPGGLAALRSVAALAGRPERLVEHLATAATGAAASLPALVRQVGDAAGIAASVVSRARFDLPASPLAAADGPPWRRGLALVRLDLHDVRQVRRRYGGTDHDVLLAVLAGALRDYLTARGQGVDEWDPRVLVPVSRRTPAPEAPCGNLLSGYLCDLPVGEPEPLGRLRLVREAMERNKAAGPARGAGAIPLLADRLPAVVTRLAAPLLRHSAGRLFDAVVTSVPIPALPVALGGAPLREIYPIVPLPEGHALGVALSAHRGTVHMGLHADAAALPDLDRLADAFPVALTDLKKLTE